MGWDDDEDVEWKAPAAKEEVPVPNKWAGEDEEEEGGDSWDADAEATTGAVKIVVPGQRTLTKQQAAKKKEAEEKEAKAKREALAEKYKNDPDMQKLTKEQEKKAQEEADLSLAMDAFGGAGIDLAPREFKNDQLDRDNVDMTQHDLKKVQNELASLKTSNPLDEVALNTPADYKAFGEKVANMAGKAGNQKNMLAFILAVIEKGTARMKLDEVNEIKTKVTAIHAMKQKEQKGPTKKPAASKKGTLASGKGVAAGGAFDEDYYDDYAVV